MVLLRYTAGPLGPVPYRLLTTYPPPDKRREDAPAATSPDGVRLEVEYR
jgi:hypothetical protein